MKRYGESWQFVLGFGVFSAVVHGLGTLLPIPTESWWWAAEPWLLVALFLTLVYRREARARGRSTPLPSTDRGS